MEEKLDEINGVEEVEEEEEDPLQVEISDVTFTGAVTINYSRPVEAREILNELPEEIIAIEFVTEGTEEIKQEMSYEFTNMEPTQLTMQIKFSNPTEVSQGESSDSLKMSLLTAYIADDGSKSPSKRRRQLQQSKDEETDQDGGEGNSSPLGLDYIIMQVSLPQQIKSEEEKEQIESAGKSAERILLIQLIGPLVLQLFV